MRRWPMLLCVAGALALWTVPSTGRAAVADPAEAAREIADARQRANDAAQAYFDQQAKVDQLTNDQELLNGKIAVAQRQVDGLEARADEVALQRYVNAGNAGLPILDSFRSVDDAVQMKALMDVVTSGSADDFDRYRAARAELDSQQAALDVKKEEAAREQRRLDQLRRDALGEVEHLKQVQADRLDDEAVRAALAAEESQRIRVQLQNAADAGAATTTITPTVAGGANADRSSAGDGSDGDALDGALPTTTTTTSPGGSTTTTSPISGAGPVGGRATPITLPTPVAIGGVGGDYGGPGWVCPTGTAAMSFVDTWGAPRSGGRRHEGVDMIGARGTPVLAVVDGLAVARENVLGGMTVSLTGSDGNRYYYAHLDGYGTLGNVTAGTVIGYVGQSGNAIYSVAHLHLEIRPGGGPTVDPYPTTRAHCVAPV